MVLENAKVVSQEDGVPGLQQDEAMKRSIKLLFFTKSLVLF